MHLKNVFRYRPFLPKLSKIRTCHAEKIPPEVLWKMARVYCVVQKLYTERRENVQSYVPRWTKKILACFLVDTMFTLNRNVKQPKHPAIKACALTVNNENRVCKVVSQNICVTKLSKRLELPDYANEVVLNCRHNQTRSVQSCTLVNYWEMSQAKSYTAMPCALGDISNKSQTAFCCC
jgi:hypothetical protein